MTHFTKHFCIISKVFLCSAISICGFAQQKVESNRLLNRSILNSSPAASSFGIFGQTPVSHFTGTPDIRVPLYEVSYKELNVSLDLKYHQSAGIKPDAFPGYTGNGWLLNTGGVITRISRATTPSNFPNQLEVPVAFNPTANANWSSATRMQTYLKNQTVFFNGDGRYDEYSFQFGGSSGNFFIDHTDAFQVKTAQGEDLKIQKVSVPSGVFVTPTETQGPVGALTTQQSYTNIIQQKQFIYRFVITDSKGIKYTFGGTNESIEFVRPGMKHDQFDLRDENTIPTSWYLTSILSPNGYSVNFIYRRGKFYITSETYVSGIFIQPSKWSTDNVPKAKIIQSSLYHPCYLDRIVTPTSTVLFNWSTASGQLGYAFIAENPPLSSNPNWTANDKESSFYFCKYPQIKDASVTNRFPDKLNNFIVSTTQGIRKKSVEFTYTNSSSTRLKLLSVKIKGQDANDINPAVYNFEYNSTPLPEYLSFKTDKYGYYNGQNLYITSNDPGYYYTFFNNATSRDNYANSRNANINVLTAEVIKKIKYPTGGSTEFEYESNQYGRVAKFWPASINENTAGALNGGGLRVKKVTNYDYGTHVADEKNYSYVLNYAAGGTSSSGVLNYQPEYYKYFNGTVTSPEKFVGTSSSPFYAGTMTYIHYSTDAVNPVSLYKSTPVQYSEVTESTSGNGYTVFKYKNYDNGYHDLPAERMVTDNFNVASFWKEDDMNSMQLERGQILSQEVYDVSNTIKSKILFQYNDDPMRFEQHVRRVKLVPNAIFNANYPSLHYTASLIYTYYPYLKTQTSINYEEGNPITNIENFTYYNQNRLLATQTRINSDNTVTTITNKYPPDYPSDPVLLEMSDVNKHIISPIVETSLTRGTTPLNSIRTNYYQPFTGVYVPQNIQIKIGSNPSETRQAFNLYDDQGNLLEKQKDNDVKEAYFYGYNSEYLVATVIGSDYNTAKQYIVQALLDNPLTTDAQMRNELNKLRINLPDAMVTTYTYLPQIGMTSATDARGKTVFYEYDGLNRLSLIREQDRNIVKKFQYNSASTPAQSSSLTASQLNAVLHDFRKIRSGDLNYTFASSLPTARHFTDTRDFYRNGVAMLPEQYRTLPGTFYSTLNMKLGDPYANYTTEPSRLCFMQNGYSVEWKMKMPDNSYNRKVNGQYIYTVNINYQFSAIFADRHDAGSANGTYLFGYRDPDGNVGGAHNADQGGLNEFSYIKISNDHLFNDFHTIRMEVTLSAYNVYVDGALIYTHTKNSSISIDSRLYLDAGFLGNDGYVDYVKVYDNSTVPALQYKEEFEDALQPAKLIDLSQLCPQTADCKAAFVSYFNSRMSTAYSSFDDIAKLYLDTCGEPLNVCN